jgi:hypothetical protein
MEVQSDVYQRREDLKRGPSSRNSRLCWMPSTGNSLRSMPRSPSLRPRFR